MERALGIGGVFLRARDPVRLAAWYAEHLGIPIEGDSTYGVLSSRGADEQAVWAAFPSDTEYLGPDRPAFMVNYRVRDLDAMMAQLRAGGAQIDERVQEDANGRFGWAMDPEGNRFELWEPA